MCRVLGQVRSAQRGTPERLAAQERLVERMTALAERYGRYGYRRITGLLREEGFRANQKWVERLWRQEGLKVPHRQPPRGRLSFTDGSCVRLRPERTDHVWSYDFTAALGSYSGGFLACSEVAPDQPWDNVVEIFRTFHEDGTYPLHWE